MERMLASADLPKEHRIYWLAQAADIARAVPDPIRAADLESERARLLEPAPGP